jgi:hypothetical protein
MLYAHVRCSIVSRRGAELEKSKTSVRKGQPNPTFKEAFLFPVPWWAETFQNCSKTGRMARSGHGLPKVAGVARSLGGRPAAVFYPFGSSTLKL